MIEDFLNFINQIEFNTSGWFAIINMSIIVSAIMRLLNSITELAKRKTGKMKSR